VLNSPWRWDHVTISGGKKKMRWRKGKEGRRDEERGMEI
jgi:hypothetical protein